MIRGFSVYVYCYLDFRRVHLIYYFSFHERKPSGVQLDRPQFHNEKEDGALERGNGADRTLTAGQRPHSLFLSLHFEQSSDSLLDPALQC